MKRILLPVTSNLTLFVISILLLGAFGITYYQLFLDRIEISDAIIGLGEMVFMAYIICLCSYLGRKVHLKILFYILLFTIYTVNRYLIYEFNTDMTPNILRLFFETNSKEVSGFFQTYFFTMATLKTVLFVGTLMVITIVGEHYNKHLTKIMSRPVPMCIMSLILLFGAVSGIGTIRRYWNLTQCKKALEAELWIRDNRYAEMPIPNLCYSIAAMNLAGNDLNYMIEATMESLKDVEPVEGDSLNIVLVIGESYNKYHSALYGYTLDDTPFMIQEKEKGNLLAFTHVKAPHNMTSVVLKNALCCNNVHEGEMWHDYPYFPAIFKKAGYDVWFWDNQYQVGPNMPWSFTLNSIIFNEKIQQLSYTAINDSCFTYDNELITDFEQNELSKIGSHNLMVFHLVGHHIPANLQFPHNQENNIYTINDIKDKAPFLDNDRRQEMADYANATRYNDKVIKHIMDMVRETNTILIYFSDHAEEVYDYRDYYGRTILGKEEITPNLIKYQIEIPFIVWGTDKWKQTHEAEWKTIGEAVDREFTTDNICHLLFRLAGIKTKAYKPTRDLLSPTFEPQSKEYDIASLK